MDPRLAVTRSRTLSRHTTTRRRAAAGLLATVLLTSGVTGPGSSVLAQNAPPAAPAAVPAATHRRPVPAAVLVAADIPEQNWRPGHRGVDLDADPGARVRSSGPGTVRFAGVVAGTPTVSVDHGDGLRTTYEPVLAQVRTGDAVDRGTVIGTLADTATLPGTARREIGLHWGAVLADADGGRYLDPLTLLAPVRVRLWR